MLIAGIIETLRAALRGHEPERTRALAPVASHWRASLSALAQNREQQEAFERLANRAQSDFEQFELEIARGVEHLAAVHADYDADLETYLDRLDEVSTKVVQRQRDMVNLALEVRALIGDDRYEAGPTAARPHDHHGHST